MDAPAKPFLDSFLFQVVYGGGYTYLDRCGQTLVDIERARPQWTPGEVSPNAGNIANETLRMSMTFGVDRFDFNVLRFASIKPAVEEAQALWNTVQENLALTEFVRVACRFQWLLAKTSTEEAERALAKAPVQLGVHEAWSKDFTISTRTMVLGLKRDNFEYRVGLQTVTRTEALLPSSLITVDPRMLSSGRRAARLAALKTRQNYNANPMYAIHLDVDCVTFEPSTVKPSKFIADQYEFVRQKFVPALEGL